MKKGGWVWVWDSWGRLLLPSALQLARDYHLHMGPHSQGLGYRYPPARAKDKSSIPPSPQIPPPGSCTSLPELGGPHRKLLGQRQDGHACFFPVSPRCFPRYDL